MKNERVELIDRHVGGRIRERRIELNMSQSDLGRALGVSFQQIGKYEQGTNRLSAGSLFEAAARLAVPIGFFYEGLAQTLAATGFSDAAQQGYAPARSPPAETAQLNRAFGKIGAAQTRQLVVQLAELLARGERAAR